MPAVTDTHLFATRTTPPTSQSTSAPEPEAYSTRYGKVRKNYMKNLFGYDI